MIRLAQQTMNGLGEPRPRIAVCGLNPHAGEDGLFGDEEKTQIIPAVEAGSVSVSPSDAHEIGPARFTRGSPGQTETLPSLDTGAGRDYKKPSVRASFDTSGRTPHG